MIQKNIHPISCNFAFPEELFFHQIYEYRNKHLSYYDFFPQRSWKKPIKAKHGLHLLTNTCASAFKQNLLIFSWKRSGLKVKAHSKQQEFQVLLCRIKIVTFLLFVSGPCVIPVMFQENNKWTKKDKLIMELCLSHRGKGWVTQVRWKELCIATAAPIWGQSTKLHPCTLTIIPTERSDPAEGSG